MNFRHYFVRRTWWGKLIGAFFGFMILGPLGALFGLLVGNFFDRGLVEHFSNPFWFYHSEQQTQAKKAFFESMFLIIGHLAKIDGRVTEESITFVKELMDKMNLNSNQKATAQKLFNTGKEKSFNLYTALTNLHQAIGKKPNLIRLFIETQYQFIRQTGLSDKKLDAMNKLLVCMRLAPLHRQQHFAEEFSWYANAQKAYREQQSTYERQQSSSSYQHYRPQAQYTSIYDAYAVLGIKSTASQLEVKKAYRRLISQNHPDKLIAKKLPESAIKAANEKTQQIRKAYEQICANKGW